MTPLTRVRPQCTTWTGRPTVEALSRVRWGVRRVLEHWGLAEDAIGEAVSVVNELVANVVQHARTEWQLVVELRGRILRVAVDDGLPGPGARAVRSAARPLSGLRLVNILALRWGWQERDDGKTVWVELLT